MSKSGWVRSLWMAVIACTLTARALAGVVQNLNSPGLQYTDIQQAIDAAVDGDVLLITPGIYQPFTIDGKSLTLAVVLGQSVTVQGTIVVSNVPPGGQANLLGLSATVPTTTIQPTAHGMPGLLIVDCAGFVRIAEGSFTGGSMNTNILSPAFDGGPGVRASNSGRIALVRCNATGGRGSLGEDCLLYGWGGNGGSAVESQGSRFSIHGGSYVGGRGGYGANVPGHGGDGFHSIDNDHLLAGVTLEGGNGGDNLRDDCGLYSGDGGHGLFGLGGPVYLLGVTASGGAPGQNHPTGVYPGAPGFPIHPGSNAVQLAGTPRTLSAPRVVGDAGTASLEVNGLPGEFVRFGASTVPHFMFLPPLSGTLLIHRPDLLRRVSTIGMIGAAGSATLPYTIPDFVAPPAALPFGLQVALASPEGTVILGDPWFQVMIDRDSPPDCNANGVNDFLDVVLGTSPDSNKNLVPDECDHTGPNWYVDDSAPAGGNGSPASPFQTIAPALQAALYGQTVYVADGLYVGPFNRNLSFGGKNFTLRSINGSAGCIIDCQGVARAFSFTQGETNTARLQGFTITNGSSLSDGGAIDIYSSHPTIVDCVFTQCDAQENGGAVHGFNSNARIKRCLFLDNHAGPAGGEDGGGGVSLEYGSPRVVQCFFEGNVADRCGGAVLIRSFVGAPTIVSHCEFWANSASVGGAMYVGSASSGALSIDNSLFLGNIAGASSAIAIDGGTGAITSCSFSANNASTGGAIRLRSGAAGGWALSNSILWDNGTIQIEMQNSFVQLTVSHCDIEGGQGAVSVAPGAQLNWGAGNIDVDPQFVDATMRLMGTSPCIDAGDNSLVPADVIDIDGDGNVVEPVPLDLSLLARFVDIPTIPDTGSGTPPLVDMGCQERQTP